MRLSDRSDEHPVPTMFWGDQFGINALEWAVMSIRKDTHFAGLGYG